MPNRRRSQRIQPYIAREVRERLTRHCAGLGITESGVVNEAIVQYLDGTGDAAVLMRREDRRDRELQRLRRDLELLSQTFGMCVRIWLAHSPPVPTEARPTAFATAEERYRKLLHRVAAQFTGGKRFVDDLPPGFSGVRR